MAMPGGAASRAARAAQGLPKRTDAERERGRERMRLRRADLLDALAAYKVERGCADCGYREHPAALQFDHLLGFPKVGDVGAMARRHVGPARVWAEVAKCEVVCANCHAIRTVLRRLALN